jgi:hypothetical protein
MKMQQGMELYSPLFFASNSKSSVRREIMICPMRTHGFTTGTAYTGLQAVGAGDGEHCMAGERGENWCAQMRMWKDSLLVV